MKSFEKIIIGGALIAGIAAIVLVLTFTLSTGGAESARELAPYRAPREAEGLVISVSGDVFLYRDSRWRRVEIGELVKAGDFIKTFENAACDIQFGRRAVIAVHENTSVRLETVFQTTEKIDSTTGILFGTILCKAEKLAGGDTVRIRAGSKAFGVRGTEFLVERRGEKTICAVKDGRVTVAGADDGAVEAAVAAGRELSFDETAGWRPGPLEPISAFRSGLLDRLADIAFLDTAPDREDDLVKVGIEVEPVSAEILVNGKPAGRGSYAGLFTAGTPIPVLLRKKGYKEESFTITPKRGDHRVYFFRLELGAPEEPASASGPNDAYALEIKRLRDEAQRSFAENKALKAVNESLKADVESLKKQKNELQLKLDDANRKIKDALQKLQ